MQQSPSAQAMEELAAELAELLGTRTEPGPERLPSSSRQLSGAEDAGIWRDHLLAEIEDLTGELKDRVARYASLRDVRPSGGAAARADAAAVAWMHRMLEDIAATALGLEIASRELFLRAGMAEEQKMNVVQEQPAGSAE
ncbi:hypothetical protein ACFVTM_01335 [Arthrobacter sp. NPDC058130]|uniref:hypothetical protein n=1 Tax=Arthrobacter sp. NPDC058130 TaxID=3346353 RepID=UPI0036EE001E